LKNTFKGGDVANRRAAKFHYNGALITQVIKPFRKNILRQNVVFSSSDH